MIGLSSIAFYYFELNMYHLKLERRYRTLKKLTRSINANNMKKTTLKVLAGKHGLYYVISYSKNSSKFFFIEELMMMEEYSKLTGSLPERDIPNSMGKFFIKKLGLNCR